MEVLSLRFRIVGFAMFRPRDQLGGQRADDAARSAPRRAIAAMELLRELSPARDLRELLLVGGDTVWEHGKRWCSCSQPRFLCSRLLCSYEPRTKSVRTKKKTKFNPWLQKER